MKRTRELRFFKSKVELRAITKEQETAGYIGEMRGFIPYASDSRELRNRKGEKFVERLAPGVFARSLADPKQVVFADVGHDDSATFARSGINLTLVSDFNRVALKAFKVKDTRVIPEKTGLLNVAKRSVFVADKAGNVIHSEVKRDPASMPNFAKIKKAVEA